MLGTLEIYFLSNQTNPYDFKYQLSSKYLQIWESHKRVARLGKTNRIIFINQIQVFYPYLPIVKMVFHH